MGLCMCVYEYVCVCKFRDFMMTLFIDADFIDADFKDADFVTLMIIVGLAY